jgi:hypothetical protein
MRRFRLPAWRIYDDTSEARKYFFFEKKKQKTFASLVRLLRLAWAEMSKSFLVLFFKKELLPCCPAKR